MSTQDPGKDGPELDPDGDADGDGIRNGCDPEPNNPAPPDPNNAGNDCINGPQMPNANTVWASVPLPEPDARTAPPVGKNALVGLPVWAWVPQEQWRPIHKRQGNGGLWVEVVGTPTELQFDPGDGSGPIRCEGPGTAYDPERPAADQQSTCSHLFKRPSAGEPNERYRATLSIVWTGSYTTSLNAAPVGLGTRTTVTAWPLPVAEAQALN